MLRILCVAAATSAVAALNLALAAPGEEVAVERGEDGRLVYGVDSQGNRIPDFSHCGYAGGDRPIPEAAARVIVEPVEGDDGQRIQAAIDQVSKLLPDAAGIRGAVALAAGTFEVAGQLRITQSGIVLRGAGATDGGSTIVATGQDRRPLIHIAGTADRAASHAAQSVADEYVPVGAAELRLDSPAEFKRGDRVIVTRPSTAEWIAAIGCDAFGVGWRPGSRDLRWLRTIVAVDGFTIRLDAPIATAVEQRFGGATVQAYSWPGRIENVGVEDVRLVSEFEATRPGDEEHAWFGVVANNVRDAWVRRVEFRHFAGGAVMLLEGASRVTVEDCVSKEPVSELGGYRRHTFFTQGQQTLFLRCWSEEGRHDFAVGHAAAGPNAFVNCYADQARGESGPLESWASGVLYDNVRIDGNELRLDNRWSSPPGAGWCAANCVLWQCQASTVRCFRPPTANNWAIGTWSQYAGDGAFEARSDFVEPLSLFQAQVRERLSVEAAERVGPFLLDPVGSTNPTLEEATAFVASSQRPPRQLIDVIHKRMHVGSQRSDVKDAAPLKQDANTEPTASADKRLGITNGWLTIDERVKTGRRLTPSWWRGVIRPDEAPEFGPSITKFAPGRIGVGLTDDLDLLARQMSDDDLAAYDHHYGLWYDRRRDDHLMVRRADGDVAPPFFEQPFARTGQGAAWDGLSKYDLTKGNPWYWKRLADFADLCDRHGLVLVHQNYFQHNILEAGAHWADSPWRPANNVNDTGFPEPPPYIGDKRIFLAEQFYDVTNAKRRELHRRYIRQCLDNFADNANVIQMTSGEYSGPLEFVQFWIDVIGEWEDEHEKNVLVGLSAPKDVQDAILADEKRSGRVDVIDIRYWAYTARGGLYAPRGGQNLAPRQHLRMTKQKPGGAAAVAKAVREYRLRYPVKAVTYNAQEHCPSVSDGWAVLMGGGSLANVHLPEELAKAIGEMMPIEGVVEGGWCLGRAGEAYLISAEGERALDVSLPEGTYRVSWVDGKESDVDVTGEVAGGEKVQLQRKGKAAWLRRIAP